MSSAASPEPATPKHDKKRKREKKRAREEDVAVANDERKHKRPKSITSDAIAPSPGISGSQDVKKEKKKKDKKSRRGQDAGEEMEAAHKHEAEKKKRKHLKEETETLTQVDVMTQGSQDESKPEKKDKKKKKKHVEATDEVVDTMVSQKAESSAQVTAFEHPDAMDIDKPSTWASQSSKVYQPADIPAEPRFPFFEQTVSLYEPLYPNGWAQPVTSCQYQHLQHLQNKYVPRLRGVLLNYKNVALGPKPGRNGAATDDETPTTVVSQNEYAVGFGWITADVELFVPSRGAWMEGSVNLQTEGHIGVVCFGKFNASVEARRLPPAWKWVSNESPEAHGFEETASVITADDHGVVRQIHSTGFWVDGNGDRVKGKVRFRIRNFDAGTSGETSYLSLEGTMLDRDSEKKLVEEEARTAQMRRDRKGGRRIERRRAPDFSMTRFADAEVEGDNKHDQQAETGGESREES